MPDQLSDAERRERLARTVEVGRSGPVEAEVAEVASAVRTVFREAVEGVVAALERSGGVHAQVDEHAFARRVRRRVGRVLGQVVACFASAVVPEEVWAEAKWREVGEDREAVRDASYGITDPAYAAIVREHVDHLADAWSTDLRAKVATIVSSAALEGWGGRGKAAAPGGGRRRRAARRAHRPHRGHGRLEPCQLAELPRMAGAR